MNLDGAGDKPRLTDQQKKLNHIESEKKRREAIRKGFEKLSLIIPECEGHARSEATVLQRTVAYLSEQLDKKENLRQQGAAMGLSNAEFEQTYRDVEAEVRTAHAHAAALEEEEAQAQAQAQAFAEAWDDPQVGSSKRPFG